MMTENREYEHMKITSTVGDAVIETMLDAGFFTMERMTYEPHMHFTWELQAVWDGEYTLELCDTGEEYRLAPGELLLIPPGCYHNAVQSMPAVQKLALRFSVMRRTDADAEPFYRHLLGILPKGSVPVRIQMQDAASLLYEVRGELLSGEIGCDAAASAGLCRFFVRLARILLSTGDRDGQDTAAGVAAPVTRENGSLARHEAALRYLDANYHRPVTEQLLADEFGISTRQVSRLFADYFGATFRQTVTDIRLRHAEKLLERTDSTAENIALRVGYASPAAFFHQFKKKYGMTPGVYRKKIRNAAK